MKIDLTSLAFGYRVKSGGNTPNWATSLGQGTDYKIKNDLAGIDELLKGVVHTSVSLSKVSIKIGKGGRMVSGDNPEAPIVLASVFKKVFVNNVLITNGKFILVITRDTSASHEGRLRLKYGPSNTYTEDGEEYTNKAFFDRMKEQLHLAADACWFVDDISVTNQDELRLKTIIVDSTGLVEYETATDLHKAWRDLVGEDIVEEDSLEGIRQRWMSLENQEFILACLDFMKSRNLFTDRVLAVLESKKKCAELFRHNSFGGILLRAKDDQAEDEQRKDSSGHVRYYTDKYAIGDKNYFVSSEWRPNREDARTQLINWVFAMLQEIEYVTGCPNPKNFARNRILFGAPGTGKSHTLNKEKDELLADAKDYERVTFHPDYSYANFVGTYKPVPKGEAITYSYVPGPFMRTYVKALENSKTGNPKPFLLIIEEINRANVAAVFGEVFQLLDRTNENISEYPVQASEDIRKYLASELGGSPEDYETLCIPDNMFIWATMNSADQGVFPMDTAFKRRWDFTYLGIDDSEEGIKGKKVVLGEGDNQRVVEWNELRKTINAELLKYKVNEDKLMGPYFISKKDLPEGEMMDTKAFTRIFKNKVLMYLFDDAAKQKRLSLFDGCEDKNRNLYSKICEEFDTKGVRIFCSDISKEFIETEPKGDAE